MVNESCIFEVYFTNKCSNVGLYTKHSRHAVRHTCVMWHAFFVYKYITAKGNGSVLLFHITLITVSSYEIYILT